MSLAERVTRSSVDALGKLAVDAGSRVSATQRIVSPALHGKQERAIGYSDSKPMLLVALR
jgi:hypothetical protein